MVRRGLDVKLNVKPIFLGLAHQYAYEGPCRFAKGDALQPEYELIMNQEMSRTFFDAVKNNMPDCVNIMEPLYIECYDDWLVPQTAVDAMTKNLDQIDVYLMSAGIARSGLFIELAQRTHKPIISDPLICCDITLTAAGMSSRGLETYPHLTWEGVAAQMKALRVRKALKLANILLAVRFNSNITRSEPDSFVSLDKVTETFGTTFRYINLHELLDYMEPIAESGNYTTPGRLNTPNITQEEIKEAESIADDIIASADDVHIKREYVVNSCKAYVEVKKLLDIHDCCGFAAPCPDLCSTRRLEQSKLTFCLTHSLLNEEGIPSACDYDVSGALSMLILTTLSGKAPYLGNSNPLIYENGTIRPMRRFNIEDLAGVKDLTNLYHTSHSTPSRKFKGINGKNSNYGLRHFAYDQGFGAVLRYDFKQDVGQEITMCRISPDCTKLFVGKGTIVGGGDYDLDNCNGYVVFRVANQEKFFKAQCLVGNHLPLIYGDYTKELVLLGESLGLEILNV